MVARLERVAAWLRRRGYALHLTDAENDACTNYDRRTVHVPLRVSAATRLAIALHECGHVLIGPRGGARYGPGRTGAVAEEIDAWDRGRALGRRLGLRIDQRAWDRARARCLADYMRWAVERA